MPTAQASSAERPAAVDLAVPDRRRAGRHARHNPGQHARAV
jgi:hypothetical protein